MVRIDQQHSAKSKSDPAQTLTKEEARAIVAPLYEALNEPLKKDVGALLAQATNPDYRSCSTLTDCLDREALAKVFKAVGKMAPNLRWTIQDLWVNEDRIVVLGEASGTPTENFFGVEPTGRSFKTISLDIFTVKNGKLSSAYHVENWVGAMAQVRGDSTRHDGDCMAKSNKEIVVEVLTRAFIEKDPTVVAQCFGANYKQHNPVIPDGPAAIAKLIPTLTGLKYEPGMMVADGNLVMVHGRYTGWGPKTMIAVDIFRVEDGKVVEHWDVMQEEVPVANTASGNAMFTEPD